jgi:hypothetical protein
MEAPGKFTGLRDVWRNHGAWADHQDKLAGERWLLRVGLVISALWYLFAHGWRSTLDVFLHPATIAVLFLAGILPRSVRMILYCFDELLFDPDTNQRRDHFVQHETIRQIENTESQVLALRKKIAPRSWEIED